jgi:hypothetical protein
VNKVYVCNVNSTVPTGQRVMGTILLSFVEDRHFSDQYVTQLTLFINMNKQGWPLRLKVHFPITTLNMIFSV